MVLGHMQSTFIPLFIHYTYAAILPVAIVEGPVISLVAGLLAAQGIVAFIPAYIVVFLGDFISDGFFYFMGRRGREAARKWIPSLTDQKLAVIEDEFVRSPWKTMAIAKASYGLGTAFMMAAGLVRMSKKQFLISMGVLNALRSLILITLGFYFGRLLVRLSGAYLGWYAVAVICIVPAAYFIVWRMRTKRKDEKALENKRQKLHR
jgi:membrane-associated protein